MPAQTIDINGMVQDIVLNLLIGLLTSWFGLLLAFVASAGLALLGLYFTNATFRRTYNLMFGTPKGRHAQYDRKGKIRRAGWAFDEDDGRWKYVNRYEDGEYDGERYGRRYTKYRNRDGD